MGFKAISIDQFKIKAAIAHFYFAFRSLKTQVILGDDWIVVHKIFS